MRARITISLWLACLVPTSAVHAQQSGHHVARFPEMPRIESLAPPETALYEQETWTDTIQHCWEWGFPREARPAIELSLRARVRALGWSDTQLDSGTMRTEGAVIAIVPDLLLDRHDPSSQVLKIAVCTERLAPIEQHDAFFAVLERDPLWPALPFGAPHVAWRRRYGSGANALGLAYSLTDPTETRRWFEAAGYLPVEVTPTLELRLGRARARFSALMWWQREDRAP